ncbi:MAG: murC [Acidimicrobiia bacterium]|nr:murC [Acidimicrobiia bacterium]
MAFDLSTPRSIHIVGVGGPGMSAIALVLAEMGHRVTGSDIKETSYMDRVRVSGVEVMIGHAPENLDGAEVVVVSTAIPPGNLEVRVAAERSVPVVHRSEMLAAIVGLSRSIGVAGTHGKTTTTSMLSLILDEAGWNPSFIVGGQLHNVGTGARWTGSEWLVVEADESDGTFLRLPLAATIVTNIDVDHLDYFGTIAGIEAGFARYLDQVDGPIVVSADEPIVARLGAARGAVTYGTAPDADYRIEALVAEHGAQRFELWHGGACLGGIELPLRGIHMARNAAGAAAMALTLGAPFSAVRDALARFGGVARRFDFRGEQRGVTLVDDYAHLPAEIASVMEAAATGGDGWRRVVAVFQPNRYSRMEILSPDYADSFVNADVVVVMDVYPSGEAPLPGVTGKLVVNAVLDAHPDALVLYLPRRSEVAGVLAQYLRPGDVCISMGCGDVATLPDEILAVWAR